jgi:hypothetical protein
VREWVVSFAQNCQFTATQQQVRANCHAADPGGNKGHYITFAAFALRLPECMTEGESKLVSDLLTN